MPKRVDANQAQIVTELRAMGYKVAHTHELGKGKPDIIVGGMRWFGRIALLWVEIKSPGEKLTGSEPKFHDEWKELPIIIAFHTKDITDWFEFAGK